MSGGSKVAITQDTRDQSSDLQRLKNGLLATGHKDNKELKARQFPCLCESAGSRACAGPGTPFSGYLLCYKHDQASDQPGDQWANDDPQYAMGKDVNPGLTLASAAVLCGAEDVVFAGPDRDEDPRDHYAFSDKAQQEVDRKQLLVAAKAAGMDAHGVIYEGNQCHDRDAEPLGGRVAYAGEG